MLPGWAAETPVGSGPIGDCRKKRAAEVLGSKIHVPVLVAGRLLSGQIGAFGLLAFDLDPVLPQVLPGSARRSRVGIPHRWSKLRSGIHRGNLGDPLDVHHMGYGTVTAPCSRKKLRSRVIAWVCS